MAFKSPDLHKPRFRKKYTCVINQELVREFCKKYPQYRKLKPTMFRQIILAFHDELVKGIIDNRDGIQLPEGLGYIFIANCQKPKKPAIDFGASIKANEKVYHANWESDNHLMKIMYSNAEVKYKLSNKELWAVNMVYDQKKRISAAYRTNWNKYHIIPNMKGIQNMFKRNKKSAFRDSKREIATEYNELNMD